MFSSRVLIDAGQADVPEYVQLLKDTLAGLKVRLSHIIVTHWHHDHLGGVEPVWKMIEGKLENESLISIILAHIFTVHTHTFRYTVVPLNFADSIFFTFSNKTLQQKYSRIFNLARAILRFSHVVGAKKTFTRSNFL